MRDFTGSIPVLVAPIHKNISAKIIRVYAPLMSGNYRETRADARHLSRHHVSGADVHKNKFYINYYVSKHVMSTTNIYHTTPRWQLTAILIDRASTGSLEGLVNLSGAIKSR